MYGATKQAINRISESLNAELVGTGVRAVAIEPGFFATEIYGDRRRASIDPASHYAAALAQADDRIATGIAKGADPAAVAQAILAAVDDPTTPRAGTRFDGHSSRSGRQSSETDENCQTRRRRGSPAN